MSNRKYNGGKRLVPIEKARRKKAKREARELDERQRQMSGEVRVRFVDPTTLAASR